MYYHRVKCHSVNVDRADNLSTNNMVSKYSAYINLMSTGNKS